MSTEPPPSQDPSQLTQLIGYPGTGPDHPMGHHPGNSTADQPSFTIEWANDGDTTKRLIQLVHLH